MAAGIRRTLRHSALAAAAALTPLLALPLADGRLPMLAFLPPVLLCAHLGGWLPGIVATLLAALAAAQVSLPPHEHIADVARADTLHWLLLVASGGLASALSGWNRHTQARERLGLQAERDKHQRLVQTMSDAVPSLVAYFDTELTCRFVNGASEQWLGRPADGVIGQHLRQMVTPSAYLWHEPYFLAALGGQRQRYQRTVNAHGQPPRDLLFTLIPDVSGGRVEGLTNIVSDISDVKAGQRQLTALNEALARRAEEAQAATLAKSAFLANMSHEIRTPMNAIIGLTHLMARDSRDTLQRERLAKVDTAAKHLLNIINDVLDLSKIEAGKMTLEREEFALDALLSRSFELVSEKARGKGLELVLDTDHLPQRLRGDATRLQQVLVNLLANAVKFTDSGWVRLGGALLREDRERVQVRFEVQDTGVGVPTESQGAIFSAFEQADSSITRQHGGTGLGLALTRHLVHMMGGEIGVHSAAGAGSRFWFTAWLAKAAEAGEDAAPLALKGLRALVVDDLPEALSSLADRLLAMGLQVDTAASGQQALACVRAEMRAGRPHDLFLIDWKMAPLDGIETLLRLREVLGEGLPPSVLVTAFDEPAMWQQARNARYGAVLVKPITPSALHDALMRLLRRQPGAALAANSEPGQAEALLRRHHAGQRLLLVEDNPINQDVAEELLRVTGLVVDCAGDGERAVEMACTRAYALVLMDVQMPVLGGLEATRAIRGRVGLGLPIVAMTANAYGEDRLACLAAGMNDHVPKPVDPEQLYATLLRWLPMPPRPAGAAVAQPLAPAAAEPASDDQLMERLGSIAGFDASLALQGVNGQPALLLRVLRIFMQTYGAGLPALRQAAQAGDVHAGLQASHSLRGACATVGARELAQQATALEYGLRAATPAPDWPAQALQLDSKLVLMARQLQTVLG